MPGLAESWKQVDDTTWLVNLRKGVKFHDGKEFTAEDVKTVYEWKARKNLPKGDMKPPQGGKHVEMIKEIEILDKYTLKLILHYPYRLLPIDAFREILIFDPEVIRKWGREAGFHPNGTGPFRFKEYVSGSHLIMERFEGYWGKKPYLDRVIFRVIPDAVTRVLALQAGEVDVALMDVNAIPSVEKDPKLKVYSISQTKQVTALLNFNMRRWPMNELKFRQAVAMGTEWTRLASLSLPQKAGTIQRTFLQGSWAYTAAHEKLRPPYNPQRAKQLIKEVGAAAGKPIPPIYVLIKDKPDAPPKTMQMVAPQLKNIGVSLDLHILEANTANLKMRRDPKMEWDICLTSTQGGGFDPFFVFNNLLSDAHQTPDKTNVAAWKNPQFDRLAKDALAISSQDKAKGFYQEAEKLLFRDLPVLPLFSQNALWGMTKRVNGFRPHDSGFLFLDNMWIEK